MRRASGLGLRASASAIIVIAAAVMAAPAKIEGVHFSHAEHAKRVDMTACDQCHSVDAKGIVAPPAAIGHSPCLSAKCHATAFVSAGPTTKTKDPAAYGKASAFCLGCHDSADGAPPSPAEHHVANAALRSFQLEREYHVEMNHFEHTKRTECRTCHIVDAKTFALATDAPGHAQCATCHNAQKFPDFTMSKCAYCHSTPGRSEFFHASRPKTDVRACGSEGHAALVAKFASDGKAVACFKHERAEHRTAADGKPVQCGQCHEIVASESRQSLKMLHADPVIDNTEGEHVRCGTGGCHAKDFANAAGGKRCLLCHGDHSRSLFD